MVKNDAPLLVIGHNGQLATSLRLLDRKNVVTIGRPEADFDHPEHFAALIERFSPRLIINAAAWTAVDLAETEQKAADRANHTGPALLATEAAKRNIPFFHVSTDYVFDGNKGQPYRENDSIHPVTAYGRTKAEGEKAVLTIHPQSAIFRTAWVYSPYGKNFVRTIIAAGAKNHVLRVVIDQKGNPTSAEDLARILLNNAAKVISEGWHEDYHGLFHATGQGEATWYELARATLEEAARYGQAMPELQPILTKDWPTPAKRPPDSRLDNSKLNQIFGQRLPDWRESITRTVQSLLHIK